MKFLIKLATRSRPKKFAVVLERYIAFLSGLHNVRFVVSADDDDPTMNNDRMRDFIASKPGAEIHFNPPPQTKISATNANIPADGWDVLINGADDYFPVVEHYDQFVAQDMRERVTELDGALWYPDGQNPRLCTMAIMGKRYYDRFGWIYAPQLTSLYADDFYQHVGLSLGRLASVERRLWIHGWTEWTGTDALYHRNSSPDVKERDRLTFERLKAEWSRNGVA